MDSRSFLWMALICLGFALLAGCSKPQEPETHRASHAVSKAYDSTTNAIKDVVEEVNEAVYR